MEKLIAFVIIVAVLVAVFRLLEWTRPADKRMPLLRRGWRTDVSYLAFQHWIGIAAAEFMALVALVPVIYLLHGEVSEQVVMSGFGATGQLPYALQIVLILFIGDFGQYWMHRALHGRRLWRLHAIHHSSTELDWLAGIRGHPLNDALSRIAILTPILCLGFAPAAFAVVAPITTGFALLQHANLNWDFGPFRTVIASPRFHRWHHADEADAIGKNFAGLFPLFDILFGTYYMPKGREATRFGTSTKVPDGLIRQLMFPFLDRG
ncbi:MAG: sterol desaturase family protein [Hyphomicrobium sp.]